MQQTVQFFMQDTDFKGISVKDYLEVQFPARERDWKDMKERKLYHFVDLTYMIIQKLVTCYSTFEPAVSLLTQKQITNDQLLEMWTKSDKRVGYSALWFYPKEPPSAPATFSTGYFNNNNVFSKQWNVLPAATIPELFRRIVPFEGGIKLLSEYAKCDPAYIEPLFLAGIGLAPVNKIVTTILEICKENNIYDERVDCGWTRKKSISKWSCFSNIATQDGI